MSPAKELNLINIKPALLWDMDGTLFDSKEVHFKSWQFALDQYGYQLDRQIYDLNFGRNNQVNIPLFLGFDPDPHLYNAIVEIKEGYFRQIAPNEMTLVLGVETWLAQAKEDHLPQVVASSAPMENITAMLRSFNLSHYFDHLISGADLPAKPAPDIFLQAAQKLSRSPESCWVIEDSLAGIRAAKNAGMRSIAVSTSLEKTDLSIADHVVEDFTTPLWESLY